MLPPLMKYKNPYYTYVNLEEICELLSKNLSLSIENLQTRNFLLAISGVESSFGMDCGPRHESAYAPGGSYFGNEKLKLAYREFGAMASCSYGPWQILYVVAAELGFNGHPLELMDGEVSGKYVVEKLNAIFKTGASSIDKILDSWNTGNWKDNNVPTNYISKFYNFYNQINENKISGGENHV